MPASFYVRFLLAATALLALFTFSYEAAVRGLARRPAIAARPVAELAPAHSLAPAGPATRARPAGATPSAEPEETVLPPRG